MAHTLPRGLRVLDDGDPNKRIAVERNRGLWNYDELSGEPFVLAARVDGPEPAQAMLFPAAIVGVSPSELERLPIRRRSRRSDFNLQGGDQEVAVDIAAGTSARQALVRKSFDPHSAQTGELHLAFYSEG